jgi:hypothetical protein
MTRVEQKTQNVHRDIVLLPALARLLKEEKERALAAGRAKATDLKLDGVQVSPMLGHAKPSITANTYARMFDKARQGVCRRYW